MKTKCLAIIFFLASIHLLFGQKKNDYKPGTIILKVKQEHRKFCETDRINLPELDTILVKIKGKKVSKLFPKHIPPATKYNANGDKLVDLSLIYELEYKSEHELAKVTEMLIKTGKFEYAEPEREYTSLLIPNDPKAQPGADWGPFDFGGYTDHYTADHYSVVHAYEAWDVTTGSPSILIGSVDTGPEWYHEDLVDNLFQNPGEDIDGDGRTIELINGVWKYDPGDVNGLDDDNNGYVDDFVGVTNSIDHHGTQVAGLHSATANNGKGIAGTGFNCKFIPYSGLSMRGVVYASDMGAKVVNCSWGGESNGCDGYLTHEDDMVNYVTNNKDVVIVAAAGNNGTEVHYWPASYHNVLSVAATTLKNYEGQVYASGRPAITDEKATWSTYNTEVDITAPGRGPSSTGVGNSYDLALQGTSYSSPIVAGAAALVRSKYPQLNQAQVRELLRMTADDVYNVGWNPDYFEKLGKGRLNMYRAVTELDNTVAARATSAIFTNCDTYKITCNFTNYLKPTSNLQVTLSTTTPGVTIVNPTINLGALATLGKKLDQVFQFVVTDPSALNQSIKFRLGFSDAANNYSDFQYFCQYLYPIRTGANTSKIYGPTEICSKDKTGVYSVDGTAGSVYEWKVPAGVTITSTTTSNMIIVSFSSTFNGGDITVQETVTSGCKGIVQKLTVTKLSPCKPVPTCALSPEWSTYFGSTQRERVYGVTTDQGSGDIIIIGGTDDWQSLPVGKIQTKTYGPRGGRDVFVARISSDGSSLLWVTILGGSGFDEGYKAIVNSGVVYISGKSGAIDFPTLSSTKNISNRYGPLGGDYDAFVSMLSFADGSINWSTLYGGTGTDDTYGMSYYQSGIIYLAGATSSNNLPLKANTFGGNYDAYCSKVNAINGDLIWTSYLGGAGEENCFGAGIDDKGNPFISGMSNQYFKVNGAITNGNSIAGDYDVIVGNFDQKTGKVLWHSFAGGPGLDITMDLAVTKKNDVIIVGSTSPTFDNYANNNSLIASFNGSTGAMNYFKNFGGSDGEEAQAITLDKSDNIFITGITYSNDFITSVNPSGASSYRSSNTGSGDVYVIKFNNALNPVAEWATYYGSNPMTGLSSEDIGHGIAIDKNDNVIVSGMTHSSNFEVMNSPIQPAYKDGGIDGFVLKLNVCSTPVVPVAKFGTSVSEMSSSTSAYPNPFTHNINVSIDGDFSKMEIIDTKGVKVFEKDRLANGENILVGEEFEAGMYFIKLISNSEIKTFKIVKNP